MSALFATILLAYLARRGLQLSVKYEVSFTWKAAKDINAVQFVTGFLSENIISVLHFIALSTLNSSRFAIEI